ncbi:LOW QUALITY PROTEIN: hypothetical protein HID58_038016 [Brassica napus]|uniref:Uncharacterized protein n=1 Tax=Brassica napus TaxID=3708 RepID=A0ABQ8BN19_BRANA|nr:LOW QUALITY PROTEIN: hypothetical protein HID58_038016 [Brassica napus]
MNIVGHVLTPHEATFLSVILGGSLRREQNTLLYIKKQFVLFSLGHLGFHLDKSSFVSATRVPPSQKLAFHLSYSTVMPPLLLRDSSAPLQLLRLYSSHLSLSRFPRLFFYSLGSLLHVSLPSGDLFSCISISTTTNQRIDTVWRSREECGGREERLYGGLPPSNRQIWVCDLKMMGWKNTMMKWMERICHERESDIQKKWKMESVAIPEHLIKLLPVADLGIFDLVGYVIFAVEGIHTRASYTTETLSKANVERHGLREDGCDALLKLVTVTIRNA